MKKRNLILTDGGMGDLACYLTAVDYILHNDKTHNHQIWCPDYLVEFAKHVLRYYKVFPFSQAAKSFDGTLDGRTTQWFKHGPTPMRVHPIDFGFHMLADMHPYDPKLRRYLKIRANQINIKQFGLPEKYICIQASFAEPVKALSADTIMQIANYIISLNYTPVFMGKTEAKTGLPGLAIKSNKTPIDYSSGIDLLDRTDMLQAARIIAGATLYIGMDSGLTHLAGFTTTPVIAGYTLVSPITHGLLHHDFYPVFPDLDVPNRFFQSNTLTYPSDYRLFPGWEAVVASMTAEKFIKEIREALKVPIIDCR